MKRAFREHYAGLFSKGFDDTQFQGKQLSIPSNHPLFIPCLNDSTRLQPNGMNENVIRQQCNRTGVSEDDAAKAVALHTETLMNDDEIKAKIITARPYMARVFDLWSSSQMGHFTLTSVGIAIAHANIKRSVGEFTDLSIWIN